MSYLFMSLLIFVPLVFLVFLLFVMVLVLAWGGCGGVVFMSLTTNNNKGHGRTNGRYGATVLGLG